MHSKEGNLQMTPAEAETRLEQIANKYIHWDVMTI